MSHTPTPWVLGNVIGRADMPALICDGDTVAAIFPGQWNHCSFNSERAAYIVRAVNAHEGLVRALEGIVRFAEANTCQHDETHRGGAIWEICDQCGAQWADDRGGKPAFEWPAEIEAARAALSAAKEPTP